MLISISLAILYKKEDSLVNEEVWEKEREILHSAVGCALQQSINCFPRDADGIHYVADKFINVVYPDLALCLIVLEDDCNIALDAVFSIIFKRKLSTELLCKVFL